MHVAGHFGSEPNIHGETVQLGIIGVQTVRTPGLTSGQDALLSSGGGLHRAGGTHQHHNVPGLLPLAGQNVVLSLPQHCEVLWWFGARFATTVEYIRISWCPTAPIYMKQLQPSCIAMRPARSR